MCGTADEKLLNSERVLVAMSGGVDSSVVALLLKEAGFTVDGVTIRLWIDPQSQEDAQQAEQVFLERDNTAAAAAAARKLGIVHHIVDMQEEFYERVVCGFTADYLQGRTPNPCVQCNRTIKFALLLEMAEKMGIGHVATGHYSRVEKDPEGNEYQLLRGLDRQKDQSYMLYALGQAELRSALFPLGHKTKEDVRQIAAAAGIEGTIGAESQEICFLPDHDYRSFLERHCPQAKKEGDIVNTAGEKIGCHMGIAFYTVGQRKGLGLTTAEPFYVVRIEAATNRLVVGPLEELFSSGLLVEKPHFISGRFPREAMTVQVKVRYRAPAVEAVLYPPRDGRARVEFREKQKAVTPGQSAVFYRGEEVVGGGVIEAAIPFE
ncbi:MAG: tRNA 2-thiouridine(34) synthase MnmA [Bacillota bacterium]|nr:tRNA 2-thiouridine(34) synthase MnmA [Bacillota bacterium]